MIITPDILLKARKAKGYTQKYVADAVGITQASYGYYEDGKRNPKAQTLMKLVELLEIRTDGMLPEFKTKVVDISNNKTTRVSYTTDDDDEPSVLREDPEPYFQQLQRKKLQPPEDGLIAVPIAAQANYITHYQDPVYINQLQRVVLPGLPYRGVRYRVFEVNGTSMEPTFREGYHVLCELVEPQDHTSIANYYVYVVVTETQVMLKRLYKLDDKRVVLISDNEEFYPQVAIRWDQIQELWLVKRKIDWEMAPPKRFEIKI